MRVGEIFGPLEEKGRVAILSGREREVTGMTIDSRAVRRGDLFAALPGGNSDGHRYLAAAVSAGAAALLVQKSSWNSLEAAGASLIETDRTRDVLGEAAARFYGSPAEKLELFGVTGTNGKTSITWLLEALFRKAGARTGVIGTVEYRWAGRREGASCTTPEAVDLQRLLAEMARDGIEVVAMEVSSHALALERVRGCSFRGAIFTNLSRDHLDFHVDLEEYFAVKAGLFREFLPGIAVINRDDPWGRRLLGWLPGSVSYGLDTGADYRAGEVRSDGEGLRFTVEEREGAFEIRSKLLGRHNVYNILAAVAAAREYGIGADEAAAAIAEVEQIPGRFERVPSGRGPAVLVDYAHTPDALEHALAGARELTGGKLVVVFGCGGDRDRGKRPLMGKIAARLADLTVLTSDNPRTEDPLEILGQIEKGFQEEEVCSRLKIVPDRRTAIAEAVAAAEPGDVVLIAGKGHEDYQILSSGRIPFSDSDEALRALEEVKE